MYRSRTSKSKPCASASYNFAVNCAIYCFAAKRFETSLVIKNRTFNSNLKDQNSLYYKELKMQLNETVSDLKSKQIDRVLGITAHGNNRYLFLYCS